MQNHYQNIYEQADIESFERQILSGYVTRQTVQELVENNQLNEAQLKVVEELFPSMGGLKNVAKGAVSGIRNAYDKGKELYTQGKQQAEAENFKKLQAKQWQGVVNTFRQAQILGKLNNLKGMFPNDKFISDISDYFGKAFTELNNYVARQYPYVGAQSNNQPFQSELDQQAQNDRENAQFDASSQAEDLRSAGVSKPAQNPARSRRPSTSLKQRQKGMTSESYRR